MASHISLLCLFCVFVGVYSYAGEYIPKSYYVISHGHQSEPVYLRGKRSTLHLMRKRRSASNPNIPGVPDPEQFFDFINKVSHGHFPAGFPGFDPAAFQGAAGGGGGAGGSGYGYGNGAHSYSFSSASGAGGPDGGNTHHYSNAGPDGPNEFARSGTGKGNNVHVSGSASGPRGAFSSSSASSDGQGNVRYSVQNRKF